MQETVHIQTPDNVLLAGAYVRAAVDSRAVLMLHMMPADRTSWAGVQTELEKLGIASLAIDLRGHGESVKQGGKTLDYHTFNDVSHQESRVDVTTAINWLRNRGFTRVGILGASIGANLAIDAAAGDPSIPAIALLSPGENYRGIETYGAASALASDQALLTSGSEGDDNESFEAAKKIVELASSKDKTFLPFASAGHGTSLFVQEPALPAALADWFSKRLP